MVRISHLLAGGGDVTGGFDDALAAVMMFIQFGAEGLEHGEVGRGILRGACRSLHGSVFALIGHWSI
jgi:hypothetical protein